MEKRFLILCCTLFFYGFVLSQKIAAKVIGVKDDDTVVLLVDGKPQTVRLAHIDCPEKSQPFGAKAKQYVSEFCFGKTVDAVIAGKPDRNGRWICEIFYNSQNLNKELVRNGLAWHYKRYSKNANYADLEAAARKKKLGLWRDKDPVAPWNWRKSKRKKGQNLSEFRAK